MSKYKIKFKAQDSPDIHNVIKTKLEALGYAEEGPLSPNFYLFKKELFIDSKKAFCIELRIWTLKRWVSKSKKKFGLYGEIQSVKIEPFTKEELRLCDSLDFEILDHEKEYTKQNITDWVIM